MKPGPRHISPGRSGFTLIELMLVVSLMTVLLAVAWPSIQRYQAMQQADEVVSLLKQELLAARAAAVQDVERHEFRARCGTGEYRLGPGDGVSRMLQSGFRFQAQGLAEGEWLAPVSFHPDGTGSNAFVVIQAPDGESRIIRCDRLTGSVRLVQHEGSGAE